MAPKATSILIADESDIVRRGCKNLFVENGFSVVAEARDGTELLSLIRKETPDLLVVRWRLPHFDSLKTIRSLKREYSKMSVLMLLAEEAEFLEAIESGADGYNVIDTAEYALSIAVEVLTAGGSWIGPRIAQYLLKGPGRALLNKNAPHETTQWPQGLTPKEREVLQLICDGLSNSEIAYRLDLSIETVRVHIKHIAKKLGVVGREQIVEQLLTASGSRRIVIT